MSLASAGGPARPSFNTIPQILKSRAPLPSSFAAAPWFADPVSPTSSPRRAWRCSAVTWRRDQQAARRGHVARCCTRRASERVRRQVPQRSRVKNRQRHRFKTWRRDEQRRTCCGSASLKRVRPSRHGLMLQKRTLQLMPRRQTRDHRPVATISVGKASLRDPRLRKQGSRRHGDRPTRKPRRDRPGTWELPWRLRGGARRLPRRRRRALAIDSRRLRRHSSQATLLWHRCICAQQGLDFDLHWTARLSDATSGRRNIAMAHWCGECVSDNGTQPPCDSKQIALNRRRLQGLQGDSRTRRRARLLGKSVLRPMLYGVCHDDPCTKGGRFPRCGRTKGKQCQWRCRWRCTTRRRGTARRWRRRRPRWHCCPCCPPCHCADRERRYQRHRRCGPRRCHQSHWHYHWRRLRLRHLRRRFHGLRCRTHCQRCWLWRWLLHWRPWRCRPERGYHDGPVCRPRRRRRCCCCRRRRNRSCCQKRRHRGSRV
mmetsp:Transcript_111265/g.314045  ORF Transcript_111265/g.314045 Transcript_111265/m.314045 type:complete len:484 (-) Transcript_111265:2201-3652(-)